MALVNTKIFIQHDHDVFFCRLVNPIVVFLPSSEAGHKGTTIFGCSDRIKVSYSQTDIDTYSHGHLR